MSAEKKIMLVGNSAWSMAHFRSDVIRDLISAGFRVVVVAPKDNSFTEIEGLGATFIDFTMSRKGMNPINELWTFTQLFWIYLQEMPNLIFHYTIKPNIWGSIAANILRIPNIAVTTGLGYVFVKPSSLTSIVSYLYRTAFKYSQSVWFLNQDDRDEFTSRGIVPLTKTSILRGEGIDTSHFEYLESFPDRPRFLLVARMLWDKGIGEFVGAAKFVKTQIPDAEFFLLGALDNGNPSAISKSQIDQWESEGVVSYLGTTTDVRQFISNSTCVVLPSYREGIPRSLLEAAAMGRPLIATKCAGCRDVILDGESGFLVPIQNAEKLGEAMLKISRYDHDSLRKFGARSRAHVVTNFSIATTLEKYRQSLRDVALT